MDVKRIVPDLTVADAARARDLYAALLGLDVAMDGEWITFLAPQGQPAAQLGLITKDASATINPSVSIEVDDVDAVHAAAIAHQLEIVHPLTDEPWGVRRFFFRDPDGNVINVLSHA